MNMAFHLLLKALYTRNLGLWCGAPWIEARTNHIQIKCVYVSYGFLNHFITQGVLLVKLARLVVNPNEEGASNLLCLSSGQETITINAELFAM